ncbi:LexA family protein [Sphingomonas profundi]|uniref:LexA family protein n=1 Tax=Alterirhizorhabdus profundi TaxID=2681549 RepID=UPI0012E7E775|nr:hypothetical protein [Sphingomonas profundi]
MQEVPSAPPRRDQALAFIIERIARSGTSPSFDEIGRHLGVSKPRARELVGELIDRGIIEKTPGAQRSLKVLDVARSRVLLESTLRSIGWVVVGPHQAMRPFPQDKLPLLPAFEHLPEQD